MTKNPKIEFFKVNLYPTPSHSDVTFRDVFKKFYIQLNPEIEDIESVSDDDLKRCFYQYFFSKIDAIYNNDKRRRKAFYAKSKSVDGVVTNPIKFSLANSSIEGLIKGGNYDTGKDLGSLDTPDDDTEELDTNKILLDDFYFSLYTPLNKNVGILILHSYTKDQIADIFTPFISRLFRILEYTFGAIIQEFMPREMQEAFKRNSVVKKMNYYNRIIVNEMDQGVIYNEEFSVKIEIKSLNDNINLENLSDWKRKIGTSILGLADTRERELNSFNKQIGYLKSNGGHTTPAKFELDADNVNIKATIFLQNHIRLEENGTPDWEQLEIFANRTLNDIVKPEVYPEDYLNED